MIKEVARFIGSSIGATRRLWDMAQPPPFDTKQEPCVLLRCDKGRMALYNAGRVVATRVKVPDITYRNTESCLRDTTLSFTGVDILEPGQSVAIETRPHQFIEEHKSAPETRSPFSDQWDLLSALNYLFYWDASEWPGMFKTTVVVLFDGSGGATHYRSEFVMNFDPWIKRIKFVLTEVKRVRA